MALLLAEMRAGDRRAFLRLAERLRLGVNLRREFLSLAREICRRDQLSLKQLLERAEVNAVGRTVRQPRRCVPTTYGRCCAVGASRNKSRGRGLD